MTLSYSHILTLTVSCHHVILYNLNPYRQNHLTIPNANDINQNVYKMLIIFTDVNHYDGNNHNDTMVITALAIVIIIGGRQCYIKITVDII